jgi:hypothetical protein
MGDDDLDLLHVGHYRGMTTGVATGLSRATALCVAGNRTGVHHAASREVPFVAKSARRP